jgi:chemotaxis protein MotA
MAFVATVYGVGFANLVLLPIAGRLRERAMWVSRRCDLVIEALVDVQRRSNPRLVVQKTRGFATDVPRMDEIARRIAPTSSEPS